MLLCGMLYALQQQPRTTSAKGSTQDIPPPSSWLVMKRWPKSFKLREHNAQYEIAWPMHEYEAIETNIFYLGPEKH